MPSTSISDSKKWSPELKPGSRESLLARYCAVRRFTEALVQPLSPEDSVIQSMPDVSPTRWHLAHTTWFFETFVLARASSYKVFNPEYSYLFNSYYNTVGEQFPRDQRGLLSRPGLKEVLAYRRCVDEALATFLQGTDQPPGVIPIIELGLQHEQQHQELILTDIKHVLSCNPLYPAYQEPRGGSPAVPSRLGWVRYPEGLNCIGAVGPDFAFDNELPRHRAFVESFELATRLVTNGEYLDFIRDGGYKQPELWLSLGWQQVRAAGWKAPMYWVQRDGEWRHFKLSGQRPLNAAEPVCHVSYFEADAFARWAGTRLPTEAEWEVAARGLPIGGNLVESGALHPRAIEPEDAGGGPLQMFGDVWEWTSSPYTPYPGFTPPEGALGEYNGKFMCNQYVLRGGSCATPQSHIRPSYRNFFPPEARWQFTGIRLCR